MRPEENDSPEIEEPEDEEAVTETKQAGVAEESNREAGAEPEVVDDGKAEDEGKKYYEQLLRLKAEFENYRKRVDREKPGLIRLGKEDLLTRLFPLYDVLLDAHKQVGSHAEKVTKTEESDEWDPAVRSLVHGLELIFSEFTKLFKAEGVGAIEETGKAYDFNRHEVLGRVETDEFPEGTVVDILQRGYLLNERVLRAAKVRIAKPKPGGKDKKGKKQ